MKLVRRVGMFSLALFAISGLAFAADPVKITLYVPGNPQEMPELPAVMAAAKEYSVPKIGAYVDLRVVGWGDWGDKKSLMIQSREEFDLSFTASWDNFDDELSRNAWIALNDLIDKDAPKIRTVVGNWLKGPTVKGKIYAVPTVKEVVASAQFLFNKKYVDKYKVPIASIKTPQDLEPWLAKIKAGEPGVVPYVLHGSDELSDGYIPGLEPITQDYYRDVTGKVKFIWNFDSTWKNSKVMFTWFKKGYFQPESADGVDEQANDKYTTSGMWFSQAQAGHPGKAGELSNQYGYPVVGAGPWTKPMANNESYRGAMFSISQTSKHPSEAIKILQLMNTDPVYNNLLNWGIEGKQFTFVNKAKGIIQPIANSGYNFGMSWAMQNVFISYITPSEDPNKWDLYKKFNASAGEYKTVDFTADLKPVKTQMSSVDAALNKYFLIIQRGLKDPDTLRAEVQKALKEAGVEAVEAELQRQVDAFMASKK